MHDGIIVGFIILVVVISLAGGWLKAKTRRKAFEAGKKWAENRRQKSSKE